MKNKNLISLILILMTISMILPAQENVVKNVVNKRVTTNFLIDYEYVLEFPKEPVQDGKLLPLIVFLHGSGERGDSVELVRVHGPWAFAAKSEDFPFILLAPQCKKGKSWDPVTLDLFLDEIISSYPIDTDRIYLTGLSRGGFGTWDWAIYRPDRFAAIAPVCGASNFHVLNANLLKDIPAWVFHGALDDIVSVSFSANLVRELRNLDADISFTVYPFAGHDSWTETYLNEDLYKWFLNHSKNVK
jgi:predicted peptidase